jgi:outer membrane lipoprotein-sorting protein
MARSRAAYLGALILIFAGPGIAAAQSVPLPTPAPQPKIGVVAAGPDSARPAPPLPLGGNKSAPATTPAAPAQTDTPVNAIGRLLGIKPDEKVAFDAKQRELVDRVSAYLSGIRTLVGDFVQVGSDGSKTKGQVYLQKPGRVRFEYEEPSPIELIADGSSVVVRDRKLATQDLYPLSQTPLRFLLADRVDLLKDTNVVGVYSDDVFATVVIEEKALGGTHRLMLMFGAKDLALKQWTITDPQGFDTTVAVYNLDMTKKLDPALFKINYERYIQ